MNKFPYYQQLDSVDCGPTCLRIIAKYYGKSYALDGLREKSYYTRDGVSMLGISDAAESIGFRTLGVKVDFERLKQDAQTPFIAHWQQQHFFVVYGFKKDKVLISDPAYGLVTMSEQEFCKGWLSSKENDLDVGLALVMQPTPAFYTSDDESLKKSGINFLFLYLKPYKRFIVQLFLGMLIGSIIQLLLPFMTQSVVDFGIQNQNLDFVVLIMIAQVILLISNMSVEFVRGWILLHLGSRINISLLSDFLMKLMKLSVPFFDTKTTGDLLRRLGDHYRIENFLTSSSINLVFSLVNFFVFSIVLILYDLKIFSIFLFGSALYVLWITLFLRKRRELDYKKFNATTKDSNRIIQLFTGIEEIKLHNCEKQKRWEWERGQAKLYKLSMSAMTINQYQWVGSAFLNELKNLVISFFAAKSVINGDITFGMMMAIQYITGQLNGTVSQFIGFMHSLQDTKIGLERLSEIHNQENEDENNEETTIRNFPAEHTLYFNNVSFQYGGPHSAYALRNVSFVIPKGKVTAIVGASGSGKTTLLKLLVRFYKPTSGEISVGDINLTNFSAAFWRDRCGAVMQNGFIFSDTIARNIILREGAPDLDKLLYAVKVASIQEFIESLPLSYNTKIGDEGVGLSQGQKQRILIARAVYKDPTLILFDEATNALDANNEKMIMGWLAEFFRGRTVVVVAHRLSTVKHADQIIVLNNGQVVEVGTHVELAQVKGAYYELVKNQLELGD